MTNKELQDALNGRLKKFDGEKYSGKEASTPIYHRWYMHEIESELESRGIEIFRAATWKIVAEIDGPGDLRVGYEPVASVNVEIKSDKRYKFGGPGVVKSIRVQFREDLQGLTIEETRAYSAGAKVSHSEKKWTSDLDNNVWEPGVYGWTEVKDLDVMTVAELKEYASENGIALTGLTLKADILAAVKTAEGVTA